MKHAREERSDDLFSHGEVTRVRLHCHFTAVTPPKFFGILQVRPVPPVTVTRKWVSDDTTASFECVENNNDSRSDRQKRRVASKLTEPVRFCRKNSFTVLADSMPVTEVSSGDDWDVSIDKNLIQVCVDRRILPLH